MKRALVTPALFIVLVATALAQSASNHRLGVWKLNVQKSKFDPTFGAAPQSEIRTYETAPGGKIKATFVRIDEKGVKSTRGYTAAYDGKDYPYTGNPNADTFAHRQCLRDGWRAKEGREGCSDHSQRPRQGCEKLHADHRQSRQDGHND